MKKLEKMRVPAAELRHGDHTAYGTVVEVSNPRVDDAGKVKVHVTHRRGKRERVLIAAPDSGIRCFRYTGEDV